MHDLAGLDSPEVLKGSHKTDSMPESKFPQHLIVSQGRITNLKIHFLGSPLRKNAQFLY